MKKSIFKRIVSAALALTMLASMAVGMSTSASAATNDIPGKVSFKATYMGSRSYNARTDYMADPDENPTVSDIVLTWNKVKNANKYRIRVIYKKDTHNNFIYNDFEPTDSNPYSCKLEGLPFLWYRDDTYSISVTAINSNGVEGSTTYLYEMYKGFVPCMPKANKYYVKNYVSSTSAKITLISDGTMFKFAGNVYYNLPLTYPTQGYKLTFTDKKTNKNCFGFAINSSEKTYKVRNLEYGHTYSVKCQSFVIGRDGEAMYGDEVKLNDYKHVK
ncbi:MAG: hypothetical protein U0L58_01165 [Ruminococcus sp.]|nr:hypothetical protein [Ruminococcus sp.]